MKKLFLLLLLFASFGASAQYGNEYLRIGDVQNTWSTEPGSIDSVVFEVKPKGLYAEVGMYFNFSTRGTSFTSADSLEIQMLFKLTPKVEVTDMWLWINDSIIKALVLDKWTASQIYEDIVDRRTDPAILYKYFYYDWYYGGSITTEMYMFRIFPLLTNLPRKAKVTFMIPIEDLNTDNPRISLPLNILQLSNQAIQSFKIKYFPGAISGIPALSENNSISFTPGVDPVEGTFYESTVFNLGAYSSLTLNTANTNPNHFFVGTHLDVPSGNKYYQLQVIPNTLFGLKKPKKALILLDYIDANCSSLTGTQMLNNLKQDLLAHFTPEDSLNIMISGMITNSISNQWVAGDSVSITNLFNSFDANDLHSYTNLPTLLIDGVNFIKDRGSEGSIVLIASSNSHGDNVQANALIADLTTAIDTAKIPIHVIDLTNSNTQYYYIGGQSYYDNQYFYINLSMLTGGDFLTIRDISFESMLLNTFNKLSGFFSSFDLYVTLESGFTYSNYQLNKNSSLTYFDQPYQQVGKFAGTGRFHLIGSAQLSNGQFYNTDFYIDIDDIDTLDYATKAIWAGQFIKELYTYTQSNVVINQIINTSIEERVLSNYTAFLALEPGLGPIDDENTGGPTNITENTEEKNSLRAFPNPFNDKTNLKFYLPSASHVLLEVYDIFGKKIAVLVNEDYSKGEYSVEFSAGSLPTGSYICRLVIDNNTVLTSKLLIIK